MYEYNKLGNRETNGDRMKQIQSKLQHFKTKAHLFFTANQHIFLIRTLRGTDATIIYKKCGILLK